MNRVEKVLKGSVGARKGPEKLNAGVTSRSKVALWRTIDKAYNFLMENCVDLKGLDTLDIESYGGGREKELLVILMDYVVLNIEHLERKVVQNQNELEELEQEKEILKQKEEDLNMDYEMNREE